MRANLSLPQRRCAINECEGEKGTTSINKIAFEGVFGVLRERGESFAVTRVSVNAVRNVAFRPLARASALGASDSSSSRGGREKERHIYHVHIIIIMHLINA